MISNFINPLWGITLLAVICSSDQINYSCNSTVSCGCSSKSVSIARIVGGETANVAAWNWVVFMTIANEFSCVGSILSPSWIITAAHCVESYRASQIIVYAGSNDRLSGTQLRSVSQVIVHPSYNNTTFVNDIALLQLTFPLNMKDRAVGQICIPPVSSILSKAGEWPPIGTKVVAVGWGRLTEGGIVPNNLQQVTLETVDSRSSTCQKWTTNREVQLCASSAGGLKDTCEGDSGGPLMMFTTSRQWVLIGLTSFGDGCGRKRTSGVYTRVASFESWIKSKTNGNYSVSREISSSNTSASANDSPASFDLDDLIELVKQVMSMTSPRNAAPTFSPQRSVFVLLAFHFVFWSSRLFDISSR